MDRQVVSAAVPSRHLCSFCVVILTAIGSSCATYDRITRVYEGEQLPREEIAVLSWMCPPIWVSQIDDRVPYVPTGFATFYEDREGFNKGWQQGSPMVLGSVELLPGEHTVVAGYSYFDEYVPADCHINIDVQVGHEYVIGWAIGGKRWKPEKLSEWVLPRFALETGEKVSLFVAPRDSALLTLTCPKCGAQSYSFAIERRPQAIRCFGPTKAFFKTYCDTWIPVPTTSDVPSADVWWGNFRPWAAAKGESRSGLREADMYETKSIAAPAPTLEKR